jgi:hypothetical protein
LFVTGSNGNNTLNGGSGNDTLRVGNGQYNLTGGEGNDIFGFYAAGNFIVHDFVNSSDMLFFDSATTGLNNIDDLLQAISGINDTQEGVVIDFHGIASITLIGLQQNDLNVGMVGFFPPQIGI